MKRIILSSARFLLLLVLYYLFFFTGAAFTTGFIPANVHTEPGLVPPIAGLLIVGSVTVLISIALIQSSRWTGWKFILVFAVTWYGATTFVMQIETWYFLTSLTVSPQLMPRLFLMGLPVAFGYIPMAIWILGKHRSGDQPMRLQFPPRTWALWFARLAGIALSYVVLYWLAGYFIAWQNPEVRAFYGSPGAITPFWNHLQQTLTRDPGLFPFQVIRALLWTAFAVPIVFGSRYGILRTALLVGIFFSIPQNIGHILGNPVIPIASVRLSHLIETASSTFVFGIVVSTMLRMDGFGLVKALKLERGNIVRM